MLETVDKSLEFLKKKEKTILNHVVIAMVFLTV